MEFDPNDPIVNQRVVDAVSTKLLIHSDPKQITWVIQQAIRDQRCSVDNTYNLDRLLHSLDLISKDPVKMQELAKHAHLQRIGWFDAIVGVISLIASIPAAYTTITSIPRFIQKVVDHIKGDSDQTPDTEKPLPDEPPHLRRSTQPFIPLAEYRIEQYKIIENEMNKRYVVHPHKSIVHRRSFWNDHHLLNFSDQDSKIISELCSDIYKSRIEQIILALISVISTNDRVILYSAFSSPEGFIKLLRLIKEELQRMQEFENISHNGTLSDHLLSLVYDMPFIYRFLISVPVFIKRIIDRLHRQRSSVRMLDLDTEMYDFHWATVRKQIENLKKRATILPIGRCIIATPILSTGVPCTLRSDCLPMRVKWPEDKRIFRYKLKGVPGAMVRSRIHDLTDHLNAVLATIGIKIEHVSFKPIDFRLFTKYEGPPKVEMPKEGEKQIYISKKDQNISVFSALIMKVLGVVSPLSYSSYEGMFVVSDFTKNYIGSLPRFETSVLPPDDSCLLNLLPEGTDVKLKVNNQPVKGSAVPTYTDLITLCENLFSIEP